MRRRLIQLLSLALIITQCLSPVFAQSQSPATATLRVRVVDPSEAAIPSAQLNVSLRWSCEL